jgi:3D (Asp-Asp-Asp) domain-containing protein
MTVTAYSPDERSCGIHADGITASNKSVWTNAMQLVAADTRLLPFGTLLSLDDYAEGHIVPVLDRGGAIKGNRLDVLYATHAEARQFGVKQVPVTIWEYAD